MRVLLEEVTKLHGAADAHRASVTASRDLKDRVAERVRVNENEMTSSEEIQSAAEIRQSVGEDQLAAKEGIKEAEGQRKHEKPEKTRNS